MASPKSAKRASVDWEAIERDYSAGILTLREIASTHGLTEGAIRKRAKRDSWTRDLSAKIRAKADELVRKELVRSEVRKPTESDRETIEIGATVLANIKLAHRTDIARSRDLTVKLLAELEETTGETGLLETLADLVALDTQADESGGQIAYSRRMEAFEKVLSLPGRVKTMKDLSESLRILVTLEREAFGMDAADKLPQDPNARRYSDSDLAVRAAYLFNRMPAQDVPFRMAEDPPAEDPAPVIAPPKPLTH